MNLYSKFTQKELNLLDKIGVKIQDRDYNKDELSRYENNIEEYIMSHSTKNGDISRLNNEYARVLNILVNLQES